ncbi:U3 small nucleolar RNA-associated protein [Serendipita sp. 407]|nr:U3 small nucleolar RNA-associated protein [Serendipita sp. 407]
MTEHQTVKVHRCRFVDWLPSPITALAFPPSLLPPQKFSDDTPPVLAVGRANGNIEIRKWAGSCPPNNTHQGWVVKQVFYAPIPSKVDSLAFAWRDTTGDRCSPSKWEDLRLFGSSGGNALIEWDLSLGSVKRSLLSQGGSIWSIAVNPTSTAMAIGCEDGCIRIVSLEDDDFTLMRKFDRIKTRILSIAWGPPMRPHKSKTDGSDDEEEMWKDTWVVSGCSDSSIRKWDARSGRVMDRMTVDRTRNEKTLVWAVGVLADGTIVSGDSLGTVKFWDSSTCTQIQSFGTHGADVLCLAINPWSTGVFTSGIDQKIAEFIQVEVSTGKPSTLSTGKQKRWVQSCTRRLHSHDVRCLAIWPPQSMVSSSKSQQFTPNSMPPLLVSAGLDMSPAFSPCAPAGSEATKARNPFSRNSVSTFQDAYYHKSSFVSPVVSIAPLARLVACRYDNKVAIWRINPVHSEDEMLGESAGNAEGWTKLLEMSLKVDTNIDDVALSGDGKSLAVSSEREVKLFRLIQGDDDLTARRVRGLSTILQLAFPNEETIGASTMAFSPDSKRLVIGVVQGGYISVVHVEEQEEPRLLRTFDQHRQLDLRSRLLQRQQNVLKHVDDMVVDNENDNEESRGLIARINRLAVSPDGQWLASSDLHGRTYIFNLDSLQLHCTLPTMPSPITCMAFDYELSRYLFLAMPDNSVRIFDVESKTFPEWQRTLSQTLSRKLGSQRDEIMGISMLPKDTRPMETNIHGQGKGQGVVVWGANWTCRFRVHPVMTSTGGEKRRREEEEEGAEEEQRAEDEMESEEELGGAAVKEDGKKPSTAQFQLVDRYRNLLGVQFLNAEELVIIERPLLDVLSTLPPAYFKAKYGT